MWIQVRSIDGKKSMKVQNLSRLSKVEVLRQELVQHFNAPVETQRLFFQGKQLVDGHTLFDYNLQTNDTVQLYVMGGSQSSSTSGYASSEDGAGSDKENARPDTPEPLLAIASTSQTIQEDCSGSTYKMGDVIDARDPNMGAWFEAEIIRIQRARPQCDESQSDQHESFIDINGNKNDKVATRDSTPCKASASAVEDDRTSTDDSDVVMLLEDDDGLPKEEVPHSASCSPSSGDDSEKMDCDGEKEEGNRRAKDTEGHESTVKDRDDSREEKKESQSGPSPTRLGDFRRVPKDDFLYTIRFDEYEDEDITLTSDQIRPRARHIIPFEDLKEGDVVMANYNMEEPTCRGFWYDSIVVTKRNSRTCKELKAHIFLGEDQEPLLNCKIPFVNEVFAIEEPGTQLTAEDVAKDPSATPTKRQNKPECEHCMDNPRRKCKHCGCYECGGKHDPGRQIICDECNDAYHLECLNPPLSAVPEEDEWYCPDCKNDETQVVRAGEKLKNSKKRAKMPSAKSTSNRDWGKGMACVGRRKVCTIVASNHSGEIPGVEVGSMWKYRLQVSEAGVHRPHVAGIHGREAEGAFSIVLAGGYEDDVDNGEEFTYTGSGGRDLSGNKRTAGQSCDQTLTLMNKALAKNCDAPLDSRKGAEAANWREGDPVRVVRNYKQHSKYSPKEGNRYDGLYKVVKYWKEKGQSGFMVWRYLLRRDDKHPAPWTAAGKRRIQELGLTMEYPEGYEARREETKENTSKGKRGRKSDSSGSPATKKIKVAEYKIEKDLMKLIQKDTANKKLWNEALSHTKEGKPAFLSNLQKVFTCVCCQDVVLKPVTLECSHNVCQLCLKASFRAGVYSCPACRLALQKNFAMPVNKTLTEVLQTFFPGYERAR